MKVPPELAILAVRRSGFPCTCATLRQWVRRGHIRRHQRGHYDLMEILTYLEGRVQAA